MCWLNSSKAGQITEILKALQVTKMDVLEKIFGISTRKRILYKDMQDISRISRIKNKEQLNLCLPNFELTFFHVNK